MTAQEPKCEPFSLQMTRSERLILERLAEEGGATLSGVLRKLLREAAKAHGASQECKRQVEETEA